MASKQPSLDDIGIACGTDKSSLVQDYLVTYDRLLGPFRDRVFTLVEIGIYNGASLSMWERYFTKATIVGIDIAPQCAEFAGGRKIVFIGSQTDEQLLDTIGTLHRPSVVIDDGSHRHSDMLDTFRRLFPMLEPGGCYIIEDLNAASGPLSQFFGGSAVDAIATFASVQSAVLGMRGYQGEVEIADDLIASIGRIESVKNCIAIWKRETPKKPDVERLTAAVEASPRPENWMYLAQFLKNVVLDHAAALRAIDRGLELTPENPWLHQRRCEVLVEMGRTTEALASAQRAVELSPDVDFFRERLRSLEATTALQDV